MVRGYPTKWRLDERVRHTTNCLLKRKVEVSSNIGCQNTTLKLIIIQGLTKTKTMEVEKLMNDHTILVLTETQQKLDTTIWNSSYKKNYKHERQTI